MGLESTKTTSFFFDKWVYLDLNYHRLKIIAMGSSGRCGLIGLISFVSVQGSVMIIGSRVTRQTSLRGPDGGILHTAGG